jgi:hypothetical protein
MGIKTEETKNERFKRVATRRTNEILEKIRILGNCANKSSYSYTADDVNKVFSEIEKHLHLTKGKLLAEKKDKFQL